MPVGEHATAHTGHIRQSRTDTVIICEDSCLMQCESGSVQTCPEIYSQFLNLALHISVHSYAGAHTDYNVLLMWQFLVDIYFILFEMVHHYIFRFNIIYFNSLRMPFRCIH
jgi:hypothetical protein